MIIFKRIVVFIVETIIRSSILFLLLCIPFGILIGFLFFLPDILTKTLDIALYESSYIVKLFPLIVTLGAITTSVVLFFLIITKGFEVLDKVSDKIHKRMRV